jgi:threonine dehydrogenase-like Zn-dependent dehydrogenase
MRGIAAFPDHEAPRFVDIEGPGPIANDQVLCRTLELGVCGTDREILHSRRPLTPPGEVFLVLGHECLARIEQVGSAVQGFSVGDLVVPAVRRRKPEAPRQIRVDLLSFDHYTERGIVHEHGFSTPLWIDRPEHLFPVSQELAPWAVLTEPFSVAEKGINEALTIQRARLGAGTWSNPRVLVTGMGPIGFAALAASVCRGWPTTLYGRDEVDSFRAQLVLALGGTYLPAHEAHFDEWDANQHGYDLILECTGSDEVLACAARALAARGVMAWLGSSRVPRPRELNLAQLMRDAVVRNHVHIGCVNAAPRDFEGALSHLDQLRRERREALSALITARVAPDEALRHYEHRQPQGIKTVVIM